MEQGYLPYKEQTKHYFDRPHEELPEIPVASPAAWYGRDLRDQKSWVARLTDADIAEIEAALEVADKTAKETRDLLPTDFPLPTLSKKIAIWREEVRDGRGFQVVRGVPVQNWSQQKAERFFWCFGLHMGRPGGQNQSGDLLGHVRSLKKASEPDALSRLYMTASNIDYHCDGADVVGLLCLNKAKTGGRSRIVSSVTVFNELMEKRPDLAKRLFNPVKLDIRNENSNSGRHYINVTPCRYAKGKLYTFYHADYFRSVQRHEDVAPFSEEEQEMFDLYETIAADPDLFLDMDLEPGDIQFLSNHTNLHARTEYEDYEDPAKRRHLLRLWLSLM